MGQTGRKKVKTTTMDDVQAWLLRQEKADLVGMMMNHAERNPDFRKQLLLNAARENPAGLDIATFRKAINDAVSVKGGFVDYRRSYDYANGIRRVLSSIGKLLEDGHAIEVVVLTEHMLAKLNNVYGAVDDSGGNVGSLFWSIRELHHDACLQAKQDPTELARKLLEWELTIEGDAFHNAASLYADVLGDEGLSAYRKLVQGEWRKVPQLGPGEDSSDEYGRRYTISRIMQELARESGNVDDQAAVMSRDLSTAYNYLKIAELYKDAGRGDAALEWAERGISESPKRTDSRLREFLAEEYYARGRHDDAMVLIWAEFSENPHLRTYKNLKLHADRIDKWSQWRSKALERIRDHMASQKLESSRRRHSWTPVPDNSALVEIFLWENDVESAWNEAQEGGCSNRLWLELSERREEQHPEDSLRVYQAAVDPLVNEKNNSAYANAVDLLAKIKSLMIRMDQSAEFRHYLASVRTAHKPKRNFTKMIDETNWLD